MTVPLVMELTFLEEEVTGDFPFSTESIQMDGSSESEKSPLYS
jgi:hypothetical protein